MEVKIIRNMVVADGGVARQFIKGKTYTDLAADTVRRLKRAGAVGDAPVAKAKAAKADKAALAAKADAGKGAADKE